MIKFKEVGYKNILSTGNVFTVIQLDNHSEMTLIIGKNGAGKSTIIEAICFALFNKPFRDITKPSLLNTINNKALEVYILFEIGLKQYKVVRGIKPNIFEIYIDGVLQEANSATTFDQDYLEKVILQMNFKTFTQICLLGNASYVPFMQLTTAQRRAYVDDVLDVGIYTTMNDVLKPYVSETKQKIRDLESELSFKTKEIDVQKSYIANLLADREKQVEENRTKIANSQKIIDESLVTIEDLNKKRKLLEMRVEDENSILVKLEKLKPLHYKLKDNIKRLEDEIEFFSEHDTCPTCKKELEQTFRDLSIDDRNFKKEEVEKGLGKLSSQIESLSEKIQAISDTNRKIAALDREISATQSNINSEQQYINKLQKDIDSETNKNVNIDTEKAKLKSLAKEAINAKENLLSEQEEKLYQEACALLLKDSGIKSQVVKKFVPVINKLINQYLDKLNYFGTFSFDEEFNETIRSRGRDSLGYKSYSEGEKFKIDLAILFTWVTIARMKNTISTNILFFDEVLDRSLDDESRLLVVEILKELATDCNIFVISHHPAYYFDKFNNHLQFVTVNNYSVLLPNN